MSTLQASISSYLSVIEHARSPRTLKTYRSVLGLFVGMVGENSPLSVDTYIRFLQLSSDMEYGTQSLYRAALRGLFIHYGSSHPEINLAALKSADKQYTQRRPIRIPNFDHDAVERVIAEASAMRNGLEQLRDRAFVLALADSGLRIEEACNLVRGDVDYKSKSATVIGKGNKQAVVLFRDRSIAAIRDYLSARAKMDGSAGSPLDALPLFARHDHGAGNKVKPIKPDGMRKSITRIAKSVGVKMRIHDLRHYFVSTFYERSNDLKATQVMARHANITMTEKYTHLARSMSEIYERVMEER